jgi:hypothetical protein
MIHCSKEHVVLALSPQHTLRLRRWLCDRRHQVETAVFWVARLAELAARVHLLALFTGVFGPLLPVVLVGHALLVLVAVRFSPAPGRRAAWRKLTTTTPLRIGACAILATGTWDNCTATLRA